jgi:hypothetical protein
MLDVDKPALYPANPSDYAVFEHYMNEPFVQLKAPVVIYMLERFLGKNNMQKVFRVCSLSMCIVILLI